MYNHYFYTIPSAFWGYWKSQVDKNIRKTYRSNRKRLSELSHRLEYLEEEKRQLEMVSLDLKRDTIRYSAGYMPVNLFVEIFKTRDGFKKTQQEQAIAQKPFDDTELIKTLHGVEDAIKQELGILSGRVDELAGMLKNINSSENLGEEKSLNIAEVRKESKHKETGINETVANIKPEQEAPAADMGKVLNFSRVNTALTQSSVKKKAAKNQESAFWGNAVNGHASDIVSLDTQEILDYVNKTVDMVPFNSFFDIQTSAKEEINSDEIAAVLENKKNTVTVLPQANEPVEERANESFQPKEMDEDARYIRQKYIVGKIAGQDLFDRNGKLIVGRSSKITSQTVEYADKEGKLPELIINMILPGLE